MPRNLPSSTGLKLFTKTWNKKSSDQKKDNEIIEARPMTATLDKPMILDISLMTKIDMSKVRKEFLNISNLCKFPLTITLINKRKKTAILHRPMSLQPSPTKKEIRSAAASRNNKNKRPKKAEISAEDSTSWEDDLSVSIVSESRGIKAASKAISNNNNKLKKISKDDNNNNKTFKIPRKRAIVTGTVVVGKLLEVKCDLGGKSSSIKLPEPCKTCGRPDQPERFHSHPVTPLKITRKIEEPPKMKSTVQKPVAIKYKSKHHPSTEKKHPQPPPQQPTMRKPSLPAQKLVHTPPNLDQGGSAATPDTNLSTPSSSWSRSGGKRTVTCYICGREFGTASLPLHEPKCLERWERENSKLPQNLQRKRPIKPDHPLTQEEWNKFAWESSQAILTPCNNCGRTFYPDRLVVHQRSCKMLQGINNGNNGNNGNNNSKPSPIVVPSSSGVIMPPPNVECYICGKKFGKHSIKIHERQCLKKWHLENESLPADMRAPLPVKKEVSADKNSKVPSSDSTLLAPVEKSESVAKGSPRPSSASKKPPLFPCYICGRLFTVNSIYIHEPQCLKMWKIENDKLPASKRRPQPIKPDVKFTHEGKIDYEATTEANWQNHLSLLVPCKICSRTFNPDRVEIHERNCKG